MPRAFADGSSSQGRLQARNSLPWLGFLRHRLSPHCAIATRSRKMTPQYRLAARPVCRLRRTALEAAPTLDCSAQPTLKASVSNGAASHASTVQQLMCAFRNARTRTNAAQSPAAE